MLGKFCPLDGCGGHIPSISNIWLCINLGAHVENIVSIFNRFGMARIAAMFIVAILLLGFFALITFRFSSPQMAPLYSGLNFDDSAAIVSELQALNIDYELRSDGETILVDRNKITQIRMDLAKSGLPSRGQVGFEIFDKQSNLGATSFVQNINQVRALEGELARTISSLARIKTARVHLVLPERELFRREKKDPSASIVLGVRGELSSSEIRAIQHLVASAIEGLSPSGVSIIDDKGRLLASGASDGNEIGAIAGQMEERTLNIENRIRTRIEKMLEDVLGAGRVRVQVSAELDLNRSTSTKETYDPESQVVRSTQIRELANEASASALGGGVSIGNELPGATSTQGTNGGTLEQSKTTEEITNYEISKVVQTDIKEAGAIKRLSIAVVVDGRYVQDDNGAVTYQARSEEELAQLTNLVRSAAGFDAQRGDQIEVVNMQFTERAELTQLGTSAPGLFDFTKDDLLNIAEMAVTLLISLALLFFVLRPLLKRVLEPEEGLLSSAGGTNSHPMGVNIEEGQNLTSEDADMDNNNNNIPQIKAPEWMGQAKQMGEAQAKALTEVGEVIKENPKQSAMIVRNWLGEAI